LHSVFCIASPGIAAPPLHLVMKSTRPDQTKRDVKLHLHRSTFTCAGTSTPTEGFGGGGGRWGVHLVLLLHLVTGLCKHYGGEAVAGDRIRDDRSGEKEKGLRVSGGCWNGGGGMKHTFGRRNRRNEWIEM
jgi:hypothetical protein